MSNDKGCSLVHESLGPRGLQLLCRSTFDSIMEAQCFQGIVDWMNNAATSKKYPHAPITSWFYWAYNPDSGGMVTIL